MSDMRDESIAALRGDLVIAHGRIEELNLNIARILRETDAHLTTAYADRDRFYREAMALREAVREYLAADASRVASLAAWLSEAGEDTSSAALALASAYARHAEAQRALVAIDGGAS